MTTIEYLSYTKPKRALLKLGNFFASIPGKIAKKFERLPMTFRKVARKIANPFFVIKDCIVHGNWSTRLSFIIMGMGHFTRRQVIRGIFYLVFEIAFFFYFFSFGINQLKYLSSLGQLAQVSYSVPALLTPVVVSVNNDMTFNILLYSVATIVLMFVFVYLWYGQLKDSLNLQRLGYIGYVASDKDTVKNVLDKSYHKTLLTIPMLGLVVFTIIPLLVTLCIAFTNFDAMHSQPTGLIDWVGLENFGSVFGMASGIQNSHLIIQVFFEVLLWTLIWACFATFSNYFLGMGLAILINSKTVKLKKLWRTILITTIAVPQFVSLLLLSKMFQTTGFINSVVAQLGGTPVRWLEDPMIAKVTIIVINMWIGIPYTLLICSGILMNIPADLYESAKIDGAGVFKTFSKITLPYMLFVTGPYLISQFVGNINNFNVIYLLTQGNPLYTFGTAVKPTIINDVGRTDLLITWIYKISVSSTSKLYNVAAVLGILIFVIVAFFSTILYGRSNAVKNEEDFQ